MSFTGLTIGAKKAAETGFETAEFLKGFCLDVSAEADKERGETVAITDMRGTLTPAGVMGVNGYWDSDAAANLTVTLANHVFKGIKLTAKQLASSDPAVWEALGGAVGESVGLGLVKGALALTSAVTNEVEFDDSGTITKADCYDIAAQFSKYAEPTQSILICSPTLYSELVSTVGDYSISGKALDNKAYMDGFLGFARVVRCGYLPVGVNGVAIHRSGLIIATRPLPSAGIDENYSIGVNENGFALNTKIVVNPQNSDRHMVAECLAGYVVDARKAALIVADEQSSDSDSMTT